MASAAVTAAGPVSRRHPLPGGSGTGYVRAMRRRQILDPALRRRVFILTMVLMTLFVWAAYSWLPQDGPLPWLWPILAGLLAGMITRRTVLRQR